MQTNRMLQCSRDRQAYMLYSTVNRMHLMAKYKEMKAEFVKAGIRMSCKVNMCIKEETEI